jgi:poly-gamma-glutamate synthesis protein (capsule biosynthesis protein)
MLKYFVMVLAFGIISSLLLVYFIKPDQKLEQVKSFTGQSTQDNMITLIATGDIIPARYINYQLVSKKDFTLPYQKTAEVLKNADITFANLEAPLIKNCPLTTGGMVFCGDENNIEGLKYAGIDIVSLANNHAGNYGQKGVDNTVSLLNKNGILTTGINGPVFMEVKGVKFAY